MPVWFAVGLIALHLNGFENNVLRWVVIYPIIEAAIKMLVISALLPNSWAVLNRFEHFVGAIFITYLVARIYGAVDIWRNKRLLFIIVFTSVMTIGLLNEQFESIVRIYIIRLNDEGYGPIYYADSFWDHIANMFGAALSLIVYNQFNVNLINKKQDAYTENTSDI